jgi:hypothetical protein
VSSCHGFESAGTETGGESVLIDLGFKSISHKFLYPDFGNLSPEHVAVQTKNGNPALVTNNIP